MSRVAIAVVLLVMLAMAACGEDVPEGAAPGIWAGYRAFGHHESSPRDQTALLVVDSGGATYTWRAECPDPELDPYCVATRYGAWTEAEGRIEIRFDWYALESEGLDPDEDRLFAAHELRPALLLRLERQEDGLFRTVESTVPWEDVGQLWDLHPVRTAPARYLAKQLRRPRMPESNK